MRTEDAVRTLLAGASLRIGFYRPEDASRIAAAAAQGGGKVTFVCFYPPDTIVAIAMAGKGHACFDLVDQT